MAVVQAWVICSWTTAASLPPDANRNLSSVPMKQTLVTWPLYNFRWRRSGCATKQKQLEVEVLKRAQTSAERQFFPDPDHGLPDPDSDADRHQNVIVGL